MIHYNNDNPLLVMLYSHTGQIRNLDIIRILYFTTRSYFGKKKMGHSILFLQKEK